MSPDETEPIPGFTREQTWAMKVVAHEAAEEVAESIKPTLYGEDGRGGLTADVRDLQGRVKLLVYVATVEATAVVGLLVAVIESVVRSHIG